MPSETGIGQPLIVPEIWEDGCIIHLSKMIRVHEYVTIQEWHYTVFAIDMPPRLRFYGPHLNFSSMLPGDYNRYCVASVYPSYEQDDITMWIHNCPRCKLGEWMGYSSPCERPIHHHPGMITERDHEQNSKVLSWRHPSYRGNIRPELRNLKAGPWWLMAFVRQKGIGEDMVRRIWEFYFEPIGIGNSMINRMRALDVVHFEMKQFYHFKPREGWFGCFYKLTDVSTLVRYKNLLAEQYSYDSDDRRRIRISELADYGWASNPSNVVSQVIGDVCLVDEFGYTLIDPIRSWPVRDSQGRLIFKQMKEKLDQLVATMSTISFMNVCQGAGMFYYSVNRDRLYFKHPYSAGIIVDSLKLEGMKLHYLSSGRGDTS